MDKISVEKKGKIKGNIEAKNNIKFVDIAEEPLPTHIKEQAMINFSFQYGVKYLPEIADIDINGHLFFLTTKKQKDEILKEWDMGKKINPELSSHLVNYVFSKCGVLALSLSQQVGLPPHIPLPKIAIKKKEESNQAEKKESKPKAS
jgi:hypothetical protein